VRLNPCSWLFASLFLAPFAGAQSYEDDVGYYALLTLLGSQTPTGAGVAVMQTEASLVAPTDPTYPVYAPDTTNAAFVGKTFAFPGTAGTSPSAHATAVGQIFYGLGEQAAGIADVTVYEADTWINAIFTATAAPPAGASRVSNNSWVATSGVASEDATLLREIDRLTGRYEFIQVFAMPYGAGNPLGAGAFNVIAVGETGAANFTGSDALDGIYVAGRARPHLVAPESNTSDAAPIVAAAAALLVQAGHSGAARLSTGSSKIGGIGTVYDAERALTVKAVLMAAARRATNNTSTPSNISGYGAGGNATGNGLDARYGAGQLDVLAAWQVLAAGEQPGTASPGSSGGIGPCGFDYLAAFGGGGSSPTLNTYHFTATAGSQLAATLAWNLQVSDDSSLTTTLYPLRLSLQDTTSGVSVALSASTIENTQNLWVPLVQGHGYQLQVSAAGSTAFSTPYALAWNITPTPQVTATTTNVAAGGYSVLTVTADGAGPFSYQWYQGPGGDTSNPIAGATGATFTTPALALTSRYWVQVTSASGVVDSATITITVTGGATDAPLPPWATGLLGVGLLGCVARRRSGRR
jgi:hypothetical protein